MMRLAGGGFALAACVASLHATPRPLVATALIGLVLAALAIATLWRWPATVAACAFLVTYAGGLYLAPSSPSVVRPVALGLCLLLLLQSVELARATRGATVDAAVPRSQLLAWAGFAAGTLVSAMVVVTVARAAVGAIPTAAAPFVAAAAALGVLLTLAAIVRGKSHGS